jgi:hypothetical protein
MLASEGSAGVGSSVFDGVTYVDPAGTLAGSVYAAWLTEPVAQLAQGVLDAAQASQVEHELQAGA